MRIGLFTTAITFICAGSIFALSASAEDRNQFFESNAVDNFAVPVVERQGMGFEYFIDTESRKHSLDRFDEADKKQAPAPPPQQAAPQQQVEAKEQQQFNSGNEVLNAYGDPGKDVPVLAQDNAPKPFKAMMAAFEAGDEQLAYGYARQWVRYMDHLRERTNRVIKATQAAQKSEELVSNAIPGAEALKQNLVNENANLKANLDPRAQRILAQAEADEVAANGAALETQDNPEEKARREIRAKLAGVVPVDPEGRVDIYVFFAPADPEAKKYAQLANQIYSRVSRMDKVNFAGFSSARLTGEALDRQKRQLGLDFNLMAGDGFAKELQLKTFPAIIFVSPKSGKILKEKADKPFFFYDELISAIQGRGV